MATLQDIYARYSLPDGQGDKGTAHSYIDIYSNILSPFREGCALLEIGVATGLSMEMWADYFKDSRLVGVDINCQDEKLKNSPRFSFIETDATKAGFVELLGDSNFDVIIDDGSHKITDQIETYKLLRERLNPGGIYVIEDIRDIGSSRYLFETLDPSRTVEIMDRRNLKQRMDDVIVIIRNPPLVPVDSV
jgi:predicted O-methyltransferase YrrM